MNTSPLRSIAYDTNATFAFNDRGDVTPLSTEEARAFLLLADHGLVPAVRLTDVEFATSA